MSKKPVQPKRKSLFKNHRAHLGAAIVLFVVATRMAQQSGMAGWERSIFRLIYELPDSLTPLFLAITQLGGITMLAAISVIFLLRSHYAAVIHMMMSGLFAYLAAGVGKDLFGRGRPQEFFADLAYRDYLIRGPGYPSGHMALATAIGMTLWHYLPRRYRWISPALIIGVGLSRMFLGVHAPLDIVGGFAIGWAAVSIFHFVRVTDIRRKKA